MTVAELIDEICRRKNWELKELTSRSGLSSNTISTIRNEKRPGTWKTIGAIIDAAELSIEDCLTLPPDPKTAKEDQKILNTISQAMRSHGRDREKVEDCFDAIEKRRKRPAG